MNLRFILFCGLALYLSGCSLLGGHYKHADVTRVLEDGTTKLVSDTRSFESGIVKSMPDIPIPATYKINLEKTLIFTSPTQTVGKIFLEGRGDTDSLYRFFEEQMVAQGWSLVNAFQSSTGALYYAKPGKFAAIIIQSTSKTGSSNISINVGPE